MLTPHEFNNLKPGDKVRITSTKCCDEWERNGRMDAYLGTIMTIKERIWSFCYTMEEDQGRWGWYIGMMDEIINTDSSNTSIKETPKLPKGYVEIYDDMCKHRHAVRLDTIIGFQDYSDEDYPEIKTVIKVSTYGYIHTTMIYEEVSDLLNSFSEE